MKHQLRIPTNEPYAYIESEFEGTPEEAVAEYSRLVSLIKGTRIPQKGTFEQVITFTGETILYDKSSHTYTDLNGNVLLGGSSYKKTLEKPFDTNKIAPITAKKHGIEVGQVKDMWSRSGAMSQDLGNALHKAMEQYFKNRYCGTSKDYHLPKHPFLRGAVLSFPYKDEEAVPEIFVSDVKKLRVGQIDLLVFTNGYDGKRVKIIDYKTDGDIGKNVEGHFNQLSYYAHILLAFDYEVEGLELWNYTDKWTSYKSTVLPLVEK